MYHLKANESGRVRGLLRTGNDYVRVEIPLADARKIMESCELSKSDKDGFPIKVDHWYFEGEEDKPISKKRSK